MKCISCGLPLSPARTITSCPRCGTPISSEKTDPWRPVTPQTPLPEIIQSPMARPDFDVFRSPGSNVQSPATFPPGSSAYSTYIQQPTPQPDQMWFPTPIGQGNQGSNFQHSQVQEDRQASPGSSRPGIKNQELPLAAPHYQPWQPQLPQPPKRSKNNLGFIVGGLCVLTGGLILILVYFMAMGLPGNSTNNSATRINTAQTTSSPKTASSPVSTPIAAPLPGEKYINNAQLASSINPTTHQATQLTTAFKANQHIYVVFQLHPAGQSGAACLFWYMNDKQFFSYQLTVYPNEQMTYSYASYGGSGSGYVEIYWASTRACSDKILAQHVDFTITA